LISSGEFGSRELLHETALSIVMDMNMTTDSKKLEEEARQEAFKSQPNKISGSSSTSKSNEIKINCDEKL